MTKEYQYNHLIIYLIIYFFFNSFLLPQGLLYTTILTPVMAYFLFKEKKLRKVYIWAIALIIPIPFQLLSGVELQSFMVSNIMVITALVFLITAYYFIKKYKYLIDIVFRKILIINTFFVVLAIIILPFASIRDLLWYDVALTKGLELIPRLKLFTYEASYYSLIMMPVFLYFIMRVFYDKEKHPMLIFLASVIPLLLSFSFGVLGALLIALLISVIIFWTKIPGSLQKFSILSTTFLIILFVLLFFIWPENPIYFRLENIFEGQDTSAMGRLVYSFMFAKDIIIEHGVIFGIGPGQIKIVAHDMIVNYYEYHGTLETVVRIPNSMAEMLAIYGVYGFVFKLFLEIYFFIKLRIYSNLYALVLFLFILIYQFTGSFITNIAELGIWAIVFGVRFIDFDTLPYQRKLDSV